jgi:hypothetical protein
MFFVSAKEMWRYAEQLVVFFRSLVLVLPALLHSILCIKPNHNRKQYTCK